MPAAVKFDLLALLKFIASISGKIPQALELIRAFIALFATEIEAAVPPGGLEVVELSSDEATLVDEISAAVSPDGTQAQFDLVKLMQFAKWLNGIANTPIGKTLISLFSGLAAGG